MRVKWGIGKPLGYEDHDPWPRQTDYVANYLMKYFQSIVWAIFIAGLISLRPISQISFQVIKCYVNTTPKWKYTKRKDMRMRM